MSVEINKVTSKTIYIPKKICLFVSSTAGKQTKPQFNNLN